MNFRKLANLRVVPIVRALWKSKELRVVKFASKNARRSNLSLICTVRNEVKRIPFFLDYYRRLGVGHFIFIDNESEDGLADYCREFEDITVVFAKGSYKSSRFGIDWVNYVLTRFGSWKWTLIVDADEFIVFDKYEMLTLNDLTRKLDSLGLRRFHTMMLDMYSDKPLDEVVMTPGGDMFELCPYFDKSGYFSQYNSYLKNSWIQGGARRRILDENKRHEAPALNKTPLVKWKPWYSFISSTHALTPVYLNWRDPKQELLGCLAHFKFVSELSHKASEEMLRQQHYGDSQEYKQYMKLQDQKDEVLMDLNISEKFSGSQKLISLKLMTEIFE